MGKITKQKILKDISKYGLDKSGFAVKREEQAEIREQILSGLPNWAQSDIASYIAEKYGSKLVWSTDEKQWYQHSSQIEGIWSVELVEFVGQLVIRELNAISLKIASTSKNKKRPSYTSSFVNGVIAILKMDLAVSNWRA